MAGRLKLYAVDTEDIAVISACVQDALVSLSDMAHLTEERRFALVANRFRWEDAERPADGRRRGERVHCGMTIEHVVAVRSRGLDRRRDRGAILELLALSVDAGEIRLVFAGGAEVRIEVERIGCHLSDLDEPWPVFARPRHPVAEDS